MHRRSFLGALLAAPVVAPLAAKAMAASGGELSAGCLSAGDIRSGPGKMTILNTTRDSLVRSISEYEVIIESRFHGSEISTGASSISSLTATPVSFSDIAGG